MPNRRAGPGQPVVVALGSVDPALVASVLDGHCRFVDVLSGREPQAVADPAWRTYCSKEIHP